MPNDGALKIFHSSGTLTHTEHHNIRADVWIRRIAIALTNCLLWQRLNGAHCFNGCRSSISSNSKWKRERERAKWLSTGNWIHQPKLCAFKRDESEARIKVAETIWPMDELRRTAWPKMIEKTIFIKFNVKPLGASEKKRNSRERPPFPHRNCFKGDIHIFRS